ncbi:mitochondrial import receptor subunit TOM20 homolog [Crassostrea virginica]|uniref:Mitochondrial import receptor subunit TOM20 homolog n=1 Tax=Crassostrea virginica TaxID=6565 RepID=A0A8B8DX93_CRAVI|nr:mitochondrial import receptor subunit TOM20 homolog [Crassostrea virginica]
MSTVMSNLYSNSIVKYAVAGAGLCFLGYCIYFDNKRRNHPDFKKKLRERRQRSKLTKTSKSSDIQLPDLQNQEAVQKFFFEQIQLGEELIAAGEVEKAVEHLSNAVPLCGQPQQLLQVLEQTLPPQVFHLLVQKLPEVNKRYASLFASSMATPPGQAASKGPTLTLAEDDVE